MPERDEDLFHGMTNSNAEEDPQAVGRRTAAAAPPRMVKPNGKVVKDKDGKFVGAVRCPTAVVGLVAGRQQSRLKQLGDLTFEIARRERDPNTKPETQSFSEWLETSRCSNITVIGDDAKSVENAVEEVQKYVEAALRKAPFTHSICLPFLEQHNAELVKNIEKFKGEALKVGDLEKNGIDESLLISSKQLHFTLLMLKIYDDVTLRKVCSALEKFVGSLKNINNGPSFPLTVCFKGVHIFDSDRPTRASIVFTHAGTPGAKETPEPSTTPTPKETPAAVSAETTTTTPNPDGAAFNAAAGLVSSLKGRLTALLDREIPEAKKAPLKATLDSLPATTEVLRELGKGATTSTVTSRRPERTKTRDVSTVTGPKVEQIFAMFEVLVKQLSDTGVLSEEDQIERHITYNADKQLRKTSLTLHLSLLSAKWRSPEASRKMQQSRDAKNNVAEKPARPARRNGRNFSRSRPLLMDVSDLLNEDYDFGTGTITELHLSRRSNTGVESLIPETVYKLC